MLREYQYISCNRQKKFCLEDTNKITGMLLKPRKTEISIINAKDYTKIHINDVITVELSELSFVRKLISINGQNV